MTKGGGEMTRRGIVINHLNLNHYDKEGDSKVRDSAYRIDSIGDTDCTGRYIVRGRLKSLGKPSAK